MRIAIIGSRGVPATFGGIERHVEEIGARLADRGHDVEVFCRTNYVDPSGGDHHRGMRLRFVSTVGTKQLDAIVPSLVASVRTLGRYDVIHYHAVGPGVGSVLSRLRRRPLVVQTIHGLDHERAKWGRAAQVMLRSAAWLSGKVPHEVIVVSRSLVDHYRAAYGRRATYIGNGVAVPAPRPPGPALDALGVRAGRYALFVGRLVPEKAPDLLIRAFAEVADPEARLVIVGGSSFTDEYVAQLEAAATADPRVILAGYRYDDELAELYSNAGVFVLPSLLEGLPLTLLEGASYGLPVVASDIPPHVEVLGSSAPGRRLVATGDPASLTEGLAEALTAGPEVAAGAGALRERVLAEYSWDRAAEETERLYLDGLTRLGRSSAG